MVEENVEFKTKLGNFAMRICMGPYKHNLSIRVVPTDYEGAPYVMVYDWNSNYWKTFGQMTSYQKEIRIKSLAKSFIKAWEKERGIIYFLTSENEVARRYGKAIKQRSLL